MNMGIIDKTDCGEFKYIFVKVWINSFNKMEVCNTIYP